MHDGNQSILVAHLIVGLVKKWLGIINHYTATLILLNELLTFILL